ncbi:SNF1- protein kinase regulatory subunit gamma-1 [Dionaea muscipula]
MEAQLRREDEERETADDSELIVDRMKPAAVSTERTTDGVFEEEEKSLPESEKNLSVKMSKSPEAKLGMRVEDLWDIQQPQLTPTEKLNACFEDIHVSSFPVSADSLVEINSDCSLSDAVQMLAQRKLFSAPVVNVQAPKDASWIDRYIGIVEFAGIVVWVLQQSEADESIEEALVTGSSEKLNHGPALTAASGMTRAGRLGSLTPRSAAAISGNYFGTLTSSDIYKSTKVQDIAGSFRWAPFLALQDSNTMLTLLLLLSKYKMKSVPVVNPVEAKIDNVITQSAVLHMLAECSGLHWFENWGNKILSELGLPLMSPKHMIQVYEDEPVLEAFKRMRLKGIGGIPVVEREGRKAVGNISIRDVQFLLIAPEIYKDYRSIRAKDFLVTARRYRAEHNEVMPSLSGMVTCKRDSTLKEVILTLDSKKIHRIYVVDDGGNLEGVITLRDIISRLVHEPRGYFGDFFDGYAPNWRP